MPKLHHTTLHLITHLLVPILGIGWLITGCTLQSSAAPAAALPPVAVATIPATPTLLPAVVMIITPAVEQASPPATPTGLPTASPPTPTQPTLVPPTATAIAPASPTPLPVSPLPPAPSPSRLEHYWLSRPAPFGYPNWTVKAYPYGDTSGGTLRPHHGVEFPVAFGTPLLAAGDGTVVVAGDDSTAIYGPEPNFYGNLVVIEHALRYQGQPLYTLYAHLSQVSVTPGQQVNSQTVIGLSGATGVAAGPHLHFEVRIGRNDYASTRNPLLWLAPFADRGSVAGRVVWPDGSLASQAPVNLRRLDGPASYRATTTYAAESLNPDDGWQENFALDDIEAGYYAVSVQTGEGKVSAEIWVYPQQTSFVELRLAP